mmetsp:Transcript_20407/g.62179  ORF Transcript_20407/g.62179 Transcript_20407/m.62179 type:complete len:180 (+) Transcript_20407:225-764(+)
MAFLLRRRSLLIRFEIIGARALVPLPLQLDAGVGTRAAAHASMPPLVQASRSASAMRIPPSPFIDGVSAPLLKSGVQRATSAAPAASGPFVAAALSQAAPLPQHWECVTLSLRLLKEPSRRAPDSPLVAKSATPLTSGARLATSTASAASSQFVAAALQQPRECATLPLRRLKEPRPET